MYRYYRINPGTCTFRLQIRIENEYPLLGKGHRQAITPKLHLSVFFDVFLKIEVQNLTFLQDCYNKSKFFPMFVLKGNKI